MIEIVNPAKRRLQAGELSLGIGLRQARTVDIGKAMKTAGFDWLFIDMEHNAMDIDSAVQIAVAAQDAGIAPLVRVPGFEHHHAARALDGGALGVVFPHVDDADTAARLCDYCRYPPLGHRSMTGALPQVDFASHPLDQLAAASNDAMLIVMMLETPTAIDNADAIAAVDGVDALLIGSNDLCMEMGIPGQFADERVEDAYRRAAEACRRHDKFLGMGGIYDPELMQKYVDIGARLVLCGSDLSLLMAGARAQASRVRGLL